MFVCVQIACATPSAGYWLRRRADMIDTVFGLGPGVLPERRLPDLIDRNVVPGVDRLVWNLTASYHITSTVFYAPIRPGQSSKKALLFHHGHTDCICRKPPVRLCRPGCKSKMPQGSQTQGPGYTWWDLYNVTRFFHSLGRDLFIISMPHFGVNFIDVPGKSAAERHGWFQNLELKGERPLRYFLEPVIATTNFAQAMGYTELALAGLSGGGWATHMVAAMDPRIRYSFPIAGSLPCDLRRASRIPEAGDFEQGCRISKRPSTYTLRACNYTCMYLLSGLEEGRSQVQILHEYDHCCFHSHGRHSSIIEYEARVRMQLSAQVRSGWFTVAALNHSRHEVCALDKQIIAVAIDQRWDAGSLAWNQIPGDVLHKGLAEAHPGQPHGDRVNVLEANISRVPPSPFPPLKVEPDTHGDELSKTSLVSSVKTPAHAGKVPITSTHIAGASLRSSLHAFSSLSPRSHPPPSVSTSPPLPSALLPSAPLPSLPLHLETSSGLLEQVDEGAVVVQVWFLIATGPILVAAGCCAVRGCLRLRRWVSMRQPLRVAVIPPLVAGSSRSS